MSHIRGADNSAGESGLFNSLSVTKWEKHVHILPAHEEGSLIADVPMRPLKGTEGTAPPFHSPSNSRAPEALGGPAGLRGSVCRCNCFKNVLGINSSVQSTFLSTSAHCPRGSLAEGTPFLQEPRQMNPFHISPLQAVPQMPKTHLYISFFF